jgi:hypothetical protein
MVYGTSATGPWTVVADNLTENRWHHDRLNNNTQYCYMAIAVAATGAESGTTNVTCLTPKRDPIAPEGTVELATRTPTLSRWRVPLSLWASDAPADAHHAHEDDPPFQQGADISGVAQMMISNRSDFQGAAWQPYRTSVMWSISPRDERTTVHVKFRDRAGNESDVSSVIVFTGLE